MTDVPEKPRWYRLTPGRLLPLLLAVEGLLFLAERFHWMSKGWPVLIAIGAVAVFFLLMFLWFLAALALRLRFQFSILSLLVLMLVVAIPCGWLESEMKAARGQREAVEEIRKFGGPVRYDYQKQWNDTISKPPEPAWLRGLLGDDVFVNVTQVMLNNSGISDVGLEHLTGLTQLQTLSLQDTKVSDAGLEHLKGLTQLQELGLEATKVSDSGLEHLKGLTQLQRLDVGYTKVSDAGLDYLKGLTQLQVLWLHGTNVSDKGVKKLQQALPNCHIRH